MAPLFGSLPVRIMVSGFHSIFPAQWKYLNAIWIVACRPQYHSIETIVVMMLMVVLVLVVMMMVMALQMTHGVGVWEMMMIAVEIMILIVRKRW